MIRLCCIVQFQKIALPPPPSLPCRCSLSSLCNLSCLIKVPSHTEKSCMTTPRNICNGYTPPHPPPLGRPLEIPRGRGSQEPKFLKENLNKNWNFKWDGGGAVGINQKPFHGRGMDIFWKNTMLSWIMQGGRDSFQCSTSPTLSPLLLHLIQISFLHLLYECEAWTTN